MTFIQQSLLLLLLMGAGCIEKSILPALVQSPDQKISVYEAMKMFTINGAKGVRMNDRLGTLEKGKYADFVVLDKNPLRMAEEKIKEIKVLDVYRAGRRIGT